ncbi:MAG: hypothetical protein ACRBBP_07950 [Bdellovibrionales bacterium]
MKSLFFTIVTVFIYIPIFANSNPYEFCQKKEPSWFKCKNDLDCQIISNPCGHPTASANKKFSTIVEKCNIQRGADLSCISWESMGGSKMEAVCQGSFCMAKPLASENYAPNCQAKKNPNWYSCRLDTDCTYVKGPCKSIAVAVKHRKQAGGFHSCEAARANCFGVPQNSPALKCFSNICKIAKTR